MRKKCQRGFSLIELLLVVLVIGIIASIAIPYLRQAVHTTENRNTRTTLKSVATTQLSFSTQNDRFGRLSEVNDLMGGAIGTPVVNDITRGPFTLSMVPPAPTDAELRTGYIITATRTVPGGGLHIYELTETGRVRQVQPVCTGECN